MSKRGNAQVTAALRRTESVAKEPTTNASTGKSGDKGTPESGIATKVHKGKSPDRQHQKGKETRGSSKQTKLQNTKSPPNGGGNRYDKEVNSEDEILFGSQVRVRGRPPTRQRAPQEAEKVQALPATNQAKTKSASRDEGLSNSREKTLDNEIPSGDDEQPVDDNSQLGSDVEDDQYQNEDRRSDKGAWREDGDNEELTDNTKRKTRDKNRPKQPVVHKSASTNRTLLEPFETDDDDQLRKRKPRNKPYSNEITVRKDALQKRKHYEKPNELKGGRRQNNKKKKKRYTINDDDESSSNHESDDEEDNFRNAKSLPDSDSTVAADYTLLECFMRQAIHHFSPASQYKKPVMYWSTKVSTAAAHMLVERHAHEIPNLFERYGGQTALEMRFGKKLRFLANNERAIQTRQIKNTYLSKQNPETRLAENLLETELDLDDSTPMRIHKNISHIKSTTELQELLVSPKMYQDNILFDIFCLGLESGNFRQNRKRPYTPLNDLITKAHEAHFRVELYLALSKKSFRHHNVHSASAERVRLFNITISAVREGRQKYLKKAVETRMKSRTQRQVNECERVGDLEENSDDYVDVEEDDL